MIRLLLEPGESVEIGMDELLDYGITHADVYELARENDCEVVRRNLSLHSYTFRRRLKSGSKN